MKNVRLKIIISFSKIMALLILTVGSTYSFKHKDASVIIVSITTAAALIGTKQYFNNITNNKL